MHIAMRTKHKPSLSFRIPPIVAPQSYWTLRELRYELGGIRQELSQKDTEQAQS